jgi:hypothetical protein
VIEYRNITIIKKFLNHINEISIYFLSKKKYKFSSKGIQKNNNDITKERFEKVLFNPNYKDMCTNKGFRMVDNHMITYIQEKKGLTYYYDKRVVLADGVSTLPLPI